VPIISGQWWQNGALQSEREFRRIMLGVVGEAHHLAMRGQIAAAEELRRVYCEVEQHCLAEPLASAYDHGLIMFGVLAAECAALYRRWRDAYRRVAEVRRLVEALNERRAGLGLPPRPHSEALWVTGRVIADVKWQEPDGNRDRLITPEQLIEEQLALSKRVRARLADYPPDQADRVRNVTLSLALAALALTKMATRFLSTRRVAQLVAHCGMVHGAPLRCGVGYYRHGDAPQAGRATFHWDYELAKLWLAGELTLEDLDYLHRERVLAAEAEGHDSPLYRRALELEYAAMAPSCQRRLELLNA